MLTFSQLRENLTEPLDEKANPNIQKQGRITLVKIRIRGGKVQRKVKKSGVKGYELYHGHLKKMSSMEKLHRKAGARRAKIKRRAEKNQIQRKRKISLRKRHSLGLR